MLIIIALEQERVLSQRYWIKKIILNIDSICKAIIFLFVKDKMPTSTCDVSCTNSCNSFKDSFNKL